MAVARDGEVFTADTLVGLGVLDYQLHGEEEDMVRNIPIENEGMEGHGE